MDNRRNDYRHVFSPPEGLRVQIQSDSQLLFQGVMVDLSLGGLRVQQPPDQPSSKDAKVSLGPQKKVQVMFTLPWENQPMRLDCLVIHVRQGIWGLQILPLDDDQAETIRQKTLWRFLLEEQRRQIRRLRQIKQP